MTKTIGIDGDILAGEDVRFVIETHDGSGCLVVPYQVESVTVYFITREFTEANASEYKKEFANEDIQREYDRVKQSVCIKAKQTVSAATTSSIVLSGLLEIDGVGLSVGDRVLVKDQSDPKQNGIYVVSETAWSRSSDMPLGSTVVSGTYVFVENGISSAATGWVYSGDGKVTVGSDNLPFLLFAQDWSPESPDDEQKENIKNLELLKIQLESSKATSPFFYKDAVAVKRFGGEKDSTGELFPAWLNPDDVPAGLRAKVTADNILFRAEDENGFVVGKFLLDWSTSGMREGDYFVCWSWRPNMGDESLSAHQFFHLGGDGSVTSSIPTHRTKVDKYEILLDRYTPEMFKTRISDSDLSPEVISEFNKAVAKGFLFIENQAGAVIDLLDANATHEQLLPLLSNMFNLKVKSGDPTLWRRQIKKAVRNFKKKGSIEGLREVLRDSGMNLLRFARLWQVVPKYTWQEHFVRNGSNEFVLSKVPLSPLDDNFRLWIRNSNSDSWVELSGNSSSSSSSGHWSGQFVEINGSTMTWRGPLSDGDSVRVLYRFRSIPAGEQEKESYIRDLPLMDGRDERAQEYPSKNWNVHLVEEDDDNFDTLVPVRHPFSDPIVWGRVRTEFPYSENLYNMEEYNGSKRDSYDPCDIDKEFVDSCGQCLSSKFNMDVEVEMLSDESFKEMRQIVEEYMPFHAVPNSFNLWGSVNEFVRQSEERIQALISYSKEDILLAGEAQKIFDRSVYRSDLPSVRRNILASFEQIESPSSGNTIWSGTLKNTRTVLLPSATGTAANLSDSQFENASFGFDSMNVNTGNLSTDPFESDNLLEVLGSTTQNYSISSIDRSLAEVHGTVNPLLVGSLFEYRISNRIGDFNIDIQQYEEVIFDDVDTDFSMLGILSQHDIDMGLVMGGTAWSLVYEDAKYSIQNILPDGTLLLEYESSVPTISGWQLKNGSLLVESGSGGTKKTNKYGLVEINSPATQIRDALELGDFMYMGWPSSTEIYIIKSFQKDTNRFYIRKIGLGAEQDYDGGDVGGVDVKIYRRLMEKKIGQFGYDSPVVVGIDNLESSMGVSEEDSSSIRENYLLFVNDEYYTISELDGHTARISGPQIFNDTTGSSVSFNVLKFSKENLTLSEKHVPPYEDKPAEYTFNSVDRSGGVVLNGSAGGGGLSGLSSLLNSTDRMDVVSHDENIQYSVEYREKEKK